MHLMLTETAMASTSHAPLTALSCNILTYTYRTNVLRK